MKRQSPKFRSGRNPAPSFKDAAVHVSQAIGPRWSFILGALFLVGIAGGVNHVFNEAVAEADAAEANAVEVLSHRPDGLSEGCMSKLVKSYVTETTVERYEREQLEQNIKSGGNCNP